MTLTSILLFLVQIIFALIEFILGLRIILKLFGASMQAPFVVWVYGISQIPLSPFDGMFTPIVLSQKYVLELSSIFAILAYAFVGYFLDKLIEFVSLQISRSLRKK